MAETLSRANPQINVRMPADDLATIRQAARKHGLTLSEYIRRTALGEPLHVSDTRRTLADHEERLERLEALTYG